MRPLFLDHNLSPRLVQRLADLYPGSLHIQSIGLEAASDRTFWEYARHHNYLIVTKDADFGELLLLHGFPPKIVWIRRGNCSTQTIETLLRDNFEAIETMGDDPTVGVITLF